MFNFVRAAACVTFCLTLSSSALGQAECAGTGPSDKKKLDDSLFTVLWDKVPADFNPLEQIIPEIPGVPKDLWAKLEDFEPIMLPNGQVISVRDYLNELNTLGKCFAAEHGQNILGNVPVPKEFAEYYKSAEELAKLAGDVKTLVEDLENGNAKKHALKLTEDYLKEQATQFLTDSQNPTLRALYEDASALKEMQDGFDPIPVSTIAVREDLESKTFKDWNPKFGSPKHVEAVAYASFDLRADSDEAQVLVGANATVEIFESGPKKILEASAKAIAPAKGAIAAEVIFWVAGNDFGGPIKYEVEALDKSDEYKLPIINVYTEFWFSIGPVPISVKLGANGDMGLKWKLWSSALTVNGSISPMVKADAYVECAVDIFIASVGAGGRLTLIQAEAGFMAFAGLNFDESGSPFFVNGIDTTSTLTLLSGELFAFVEFPIPLPPFMQRLEKSLYKYPGVVKKEPGIAVNFSKTTKPQGVVLSGDADPEDYEATDLDNLQTKIVERVVTELNSDGPQLNDETKKSLAVLDALDANVLSKSVSKISSWK